MMFFKSRIKIEILFFRFNAKPEIGKPFSRTNFDDFFNAMLAVFQVWFFFFFFFCNQSYNVKIFSNKLKVKLLLRVSMCVSGMCCTRHGYRCMAKLTRELGYIIFHSYVLLRMPMPYFWIHASYRAKLSWTQF